MRADMNGLTAALRAALPAMKLTENAPMDRLTTLRLGGPCDLLAEPASAEEVRILMDIVRMADVPLTVIGRGSNLLVRDGGIRGLVVRIGPELKEIRTCEGGLEVAAGASMAAVAAFAASQSLNGLAWAGGIPGAIGGAVCMNAGAYGGEMSQVTAMVSGFDLNGRPFCYADSDMGFSYRTSRLQNESRIVTSVTLHLEPGDEAEIRAVMAQNARARAEKQPLDQPSAGSTFRRPQNGYAAAMIDGCGLKGFSIGGASVSEKHAGFLVNNGGTAADFLALMAHVQNAVFEKYSTMLEPEVMVLGDD